MSGAYFYTSLIFACLSAVLIYIIIFRADARIDSVLSISPTIRHNFAEQNIGSDGTGTATSGKLFRGDRFRIFDEGLIRYSDFQKIAQKTKYSGEIDEHVGDLFCNHWSVVTTIFKPSEAVIRQAQLQNWCLVIVGDKKGPKDYPIPASMHGHNANHTENVVYLTVDRQLELEEHLPLLSHLPWNHFGRKNVGYLYAILHGATVVWDFDDDNLLLQSDGMLTIPGLETGSVPIVRRLHAYKPDVNEKLNMENTDSKVLRHRQLVDQNVTDHESTEVGVRARRSLAISLIRRELHGRNYITDPRSFSSICKAREVGAKGRGWPREFAAFNPYPIMGAPSQPSWPRGLPLELIKKDGYSKVLSDVNLTLDSVGVVQALANGDPDVDAIYRLTQPLPFSFPSRSANSRNISPLLQKDASERDGETILPLLVPAHAYAPYNAQATLHFYPALWSLLLPVTVHGRVSDIWRGYLAQKLFRDVGLQLLFSPPLVRQDRNAHNYIGDLESESPLYARAHVLVAQLNELQLQNSIRNFPGRMEELWIWAYEHGYLEKEDVTLCQAWIQSLMVVGYTFPRAKLF